MTTYYIDPASGCDTNSGQTNSEPWRSFAPLESVVLGPGDRVEVVAPGALERCPVITGEGLADAPIEIVFAPGRYDLFPEKTSKRCYNITNNNEEPEVPKPIGILVEKARNVVISGPGARLVARGKMIVLSIDHSQDITVRDLAVDYHRPTVSEFTVDSVTDSTADIVVHPDSAYSLRNG